MPRVQIADQLLNKSDFRDYVMWHVGRYPSFHLTLLFENGQGYHIVLHDGVGCKERIGVTFSRGIMEPTPVVYDILKKELHWSPGIDRVARQILGPRGKKGSVLLIVENREVTEANFHRGECWP